MTRWERFKLWFKPLVYQGTQAHGKSVLMIHEDGDTRRWDDVDRYIVGETAQFDSAYGVDRTVWVEVLLTSGKRDSYGMAVWHRGEVQVVVQ